MLMILFMLMILSILMMLSMLMILLCALSVIRFLISVLNSLSYLLNLNLTYEALWTGVGKGLFILMLGKLTLLHCIVQIALVLWKRK